MPPLRHAIPRAFPMRFDGAPRQEKDLAALSARRLPIGDFFLLRARVRFDMRSGRVPRADGSFARAREGRIGPDRVSKRMQRARAVRRTARSGGAQDVLFALMKPAAERTGDPAHARVRQEQKVP